MLSVVMGADAHIHGSCHCGAVRVSVRLSRTPQEIELRACQCSFCRRHGARTFADPSGHALIESASAADIRDYRFGQRTADFLICAECGVYVAAVIEAPGGLHATINAAGLGFAEFEGREAAAAEYGAETRAERIERRYRRWMPIELKVNAAAVSREKESCA